MYTIFDLQYGEMKEGVVYPGEVRVGLSLDPQAEGCSDVLEDATNCTAVITRDDIMYTINLTLSNDVAQTHPVMKMFECKCVAVAIIMILLFVQSYNLLWYSCQTRI